MELKWLEVALDLVQLGRRVARYIGASAVVVDTELTKQIADEAEEFSKELKAALAKVEST